MKNKKVYTEEIMKAIPRLLSSQDRDPTSHTYGCFDREYWAWATKDFANIDLQRGVYPLALLWSKNFKGNPYFNNKKIFEWLVAGINFWCKVQHKDGSFDHLYINEHSFAGTAFTLYEIGETYMIIEKKLDDKTKERFMKSIKKAADFLVKFDETHGFISNHRACAACALKISYNILKDEKYQKEAIFYINTIKKMQSDDGWFLEYGGADPGYQTLDTFYLSCYHKMTGDSVVLDMLRKSLEFITYFIHPNGTIGGEYGSRNTELYYPSGFEYLSDKIPEAAAVSERFRESIGKHSMHLSETDIRNFIPFLTSYTLAFFEKSKPMKGKKLPYETEFEKYFPDGQLFIMSTKSYYAILGISKGGVLKVYDKKTKKLIHSECGYFGKTKSGLAISSQMLDFINNVTVEKGSVRFTTSFFRVPFRVMTPLRFFLFRIFNLTSGRFYSLNNLVRKDLIVKRLIMPKNKVKLELERNFTFSNNFITIDDIFTNKGIKLKEIRKVEKFATVFMASAKYYQKQDLTKSAIQEKNLAGEIIRNKRASFNYKITV